jgi:hypothetical protein
LISAGSVGTVRLPPVTSLVRGGRDHARLALARRASGTPFVQRWLVARAARETLQWLDPPDDPVADLHAAESSTYSQNGEDGLLAALFERVGAPTRVFAEIGASDGAENCTRALAEQGWRGFWFEGDPERVARAEVTAAALDVDVTQAMVSAANVAQLFAGAGVPAQLDLLVVDIDSNDYWVLGAALAVCTPRVVVVEYNATFAPGSFWTRRDRDHGAWNETYRHGASLDALTWTAGRAGYQLVACDSHGVNAFFVRRDVARAAEFEPAPLRALYRPMTLWPPLRGHPWRVEPPCPYLTDDELQQVRVAHVEILGQRRLASGTRAVALLAEIENNTARRLTSAGPTPMRLSALTLADDQTVLDDNGTRNVLLGGIRPRGTSWAAGVFTVVDDRATVLRVSLVQDGVAWLAGTVDVPLA